MKALLPIILVIAVTATVALYLTTRSDSHVYSYTALIDALRRHPGEVLGHTLLVRAQAEDTSFLPGPAMRLYDPQSTDLPLALHPGPANPVFALLRGGPLIGALIPGVQRPDLDYLAVYRVRIERGRGMDCLFMPTLCYRAVLLDAAPFPE